MVSSTGERVGEPQIIEAFHVLARRSLAQAKSDGLIDDDYLRSATASELQILGPALTLFFAALANTTDPPSVHVETSPSHPAFVLSLATCPTNLLPLFRLWSKAVQPLQDLSLDDQADVARLICDLEPLSTPISTVMIRLATDVQSMAITISQRKTFLERYTQDLEVGLAAGRSPMNFQAPPDYIPQQTPPSTSHSHPSHLSPQDAIPATEDPALEAVRETLYAAIAEAIETSNRLGELLRRDPAQGFFTAVALAIVEAATKNLTPDGQRVRVVSYGSGHSRTRSFGTDDAPSELRVFVRELVRLGAILRDVSEKDDARAIELAVRGEDDLGRLTLMELLRQELELGAESNPGESGEIAEIRSIANFINRMAIAVTALPGFQQRTGVFEILRGLSR